MKASHRYAVAFAGAVTALLATSAGSAEAQQVCRSAPPADVPRIMVTPLRSAENPALGVAAADEIRERFAREFSCREMLVISKNDVVRTLEASGYPTDRALSPTDAKQLATLLRADQYVAGTVQRTPQGVRLDAGLVLTRDPALVQPFEPIVAENVDDAAKVLRREVETAQRQLQGERECVAALRGGNPQQAVAAARQGIAAYPRSTLARLCLAAAYAEMKMAPDSILRMTDEILAIDPRSRIALELAAQAYEATGQDQRAVETWTRLIALDPTNTRLVERATGVLVRSGNAAAAKPILDTAVAENPNDLSLQRLQWLVLLTIKDWEGAIEVGERLVQIDTSIADTTFFTRLATAYAADSQYQQAAEVVARGLAKFPQNANLHLVHAQMLRQAGQLEPAIVAVRRAVELDSGIDRANVQMAQIYMDLSQPDSAYTALERALAAGDDSTFIAQYALSLGNQTYRAANTSKALADFQTAARFLGISDRISPSPQASLLLGMSSFSIGQQAATQAPKEQSCELARLAQSSFRTAQTEITEGAEVAPQAAEQYLGYLQQFIPVVENQVKRFCR